MSFGELLRQYVAVTDDQVAKLEAHYRLMLAWNRKINLTRIVDLEGAVKKHYAESVFLASQLPADVLTVADVGSGAGFPGIPIAVIRSDIKLALLESDQRKAVFLREATTDLPNVEVMAVRAERVDRHFDCIVSRAVSPAEVARLVPRSAPKAFMLVSADQLSSTWNAIAVVPWQRQSVIAEFHMEQSSS